LYQSSLWLLHFNKLLLFHHFILDRCHTCDFVAQLVFRDKVARVTRRVAQPFNSRATLFPNRAAALFFATLSQSTSCATK